MPTWLKWIAGILAACLLVAVAIVAVQYLILTQVLDDIGF
jgi:hypothetical protein